MTATNSKNLHPLTDFTSLLRYHTLTPQEKIQLVEKGVTGSQLAKFKELIDQSYDSLAEMIGWTSRTLLTKSASRASYCSHLMSDRILEIADIFSMGYAAFKEPIYFNTWLTSPHPALARNAPITLMFTFAGKLWIREILQRQMKKNNEISSDISEVNNSII